MREKGPYEDPKTPSGKEGKQRPPSIIGVGGAYTVNDSWAVAGGYQNNWINDSLRYSGGLGYTSLNLDFYGIGQRQRPRLINLDESSIEFNIEGFITLHDLRYRLLNTNFFIGTRYAFLSSETTFSLGPTELIPPFQRESNDGALGATFMYDTRDNTFTPTRGSKVDLSGMFHSPSFGGDFNYERYQAAGLTWIGVHPDVTLGLRLDARWVDGRAPFYAIPFIDLRGIPALRYQDKLVLMGEVEARWQAFQRWSILGFVGSGRAAEALDELGSAEGRHTFGTGFRYLVARKFGLHSGVDIARGPEDTYVYIQVGSAW